MVQIREKCGQGLCKVIITFYLQPPILYFVITDLSFLSVYLQKRKTDLFHNANEFSLIAPGISDNHEHKLFMFVVENHVCHRWLTWPPDYGYTSGILTQTV